MPASSPHVADRERRAIETLYATAHHLLDRSCWSDAAAVLRVMLQASPTDERGWLALGDCHARAGHTGVALELYGAGTFAAAPGFRCAIARFRLLFDLGRTTDADHAFDAAVAIAERENDDDLAEMLANERRIRP